MLGKDKNLLNKELSEEDIKVVNGAGAPNQKPDADPGEHRWGTDKGGSLGEYSPYNPNNPGGGI